MSSRPTVMVRGAPVEVFRFRPGAEARDHPRIQFRPAWEPEMGGGPGFPDSYMFKGTPYAFTVDGRSELEPGDVLLTFANGDCIAMREGLFHALYAKAGALP